MKNLSKKLLCACMLLCSLGAFSQKQVQPVPLNEPDLKRPKLFADLPDKIPVSAEKLSSLLNTTVGTLVSIDLTQQNSLQGKVISSESKFDNGLQTVVISSTNYRGANLTISKTTQKDGTISYSGRVISFKHGDLLELKNQSGSLVFIKRNYYELINE